MPSYELTRCAVCGHADTTELAAITQPGKAASGIRQLPNVVAVGGGIVIRAKGSIVGGIGVSGAPFSPLTTRCTRITGSVGRPSRSDATSIHHSSPFLASNSYTSTSAAG